MGALFSFARKLMAVLVAACLPLGALAGGYTIDMTAIPPSGSNVGAGHLITYIITVTNVVTGDSTSGNGFIRAYDNSPSQTLFQFNPGAPNGVMTQPGAGSAWNCAITPNGNGTNQFICYAGDGIGGAADTFATGQSLVLKVDALVSSAATTGSVKTNTAFFETDLDGNGIDETLIEPPTPVSHTVVYIVTYDGNGNTGGTAPTDNNIYAAGAPVTVLGNTGALVKTGFNFAGWNAAANGSSGSYVPGNTFNMGVVSNVTLYAKWSTGPCTLDVDGNNSVDALTDGLVIIRAMFGLTGTAATNGVVGAGAARADWASIRGFLNANCGTSFAP